MAEEYEKLLDKLYSNLPAKRTSGERFEIPIAKCFVQGNKTVIGNYGEIYSRLRRTPEELSKYLFKELATPGVISGQQLILQSKVNPRLVNEKITSYCEIYVICRECGKPDTHLDAVNRNVRMLVCEACGAKKPVRF